MDNNYTNQNLYNDKMDYNNRNNQECYNDNEEEEKKEEINKYMQEIRLGFVRKVLGIVCAQLFLTALISLMCMLSQSFLSFIINNITLIKFSLILLLIVFIFSQCLCPALCRKVPYNYIMLLLITLLVSLLVGLICAISNPVNVCIAVCITFIMVLGLTLYAVFTDHDLTIANSFFLLICIAMLLALIAFIVSPLNSFFLIILFLLNGIILGAYIVYDIQLIVGNKHYAFSIDDYVSAAISLYLDIINLFLFILRLLNIFNNN